MFHSGLGSSLLSLEKDHLVKATVLASLLGAGERRVLAHALDDSGVKAGGAVELVAEHASVARVGCVVACSAGELKCARLLVFLGVEHVGAFGAELKLDGLFGVRLLAILAGS